MDFITSVTNLSNWTLSLVLGIGAALLSGSRGGIVGELPFSDTLLLFPTIPKVIEGSTIAITKRSWWCLMILKSFYNKDLNMGHIILDGKEFAECGCMKTTTIIKKIEPQMLYGLISEENHKIVVHKIDCFLKTVVHFRTYEFFTNKVQIHVKSMTNKECHVFCESFLEKMINLINDCLAANEWDKRIMRRIKVLVNDLEGNHENDDEGRNMDHETMDRIFSRISDMYSRLDINTIAVDGMIFNLEEAIQVIVLYFGIKRTIICSKIIYNTNSIVISGYNSQIGHEMINDLTLIPAEEKIGYSGITVIESSKLERIIRRSINDIKTLIIPCLDTVLAAIIMILSALGPVLSMYSSRRMTAPYRESLLRMGTSLRWSVSKVYMWHTGSARDDWIMCVQPSIHVNLKMWLFLIISLLPPTATIVIWVLYHPSLIFINQMGKVIAWCGISLGICWVFMGILVKKRDYLDMTICLSTIISLLVVMITVENFTYWIYVYLFEFLFTLLWAIGETRYKWLSESTALLMLGVVGAIRLASIQNN